MRRFFGAILRVLRYLFNVTRNLSLLIVLAMVLIFVAIKENPAELERFVLALDRDFHAERTTPFASSILNTPTSPSRSESSYLSVGDDRVNSTFDPADFIYATTTGEKGKIYLSIHGRDIVKRRGYIKQLRQRLPRHSAELFQTGSHLFNLSYVRSIERDTLRTTRSRIYTITLDNGCDTRNSIKLPNSKNADFDAAWDRFSR